MSLFNSFRIKISQLNVIISVKDSLFHAKTMQKTEMPILIVDKLYIPVTYLNFYPSDKLTIEDNFCQLVPFIERFHNEFEFIPR